MIRELVFLALSSSAFAQIPDAPSAIKQENIWVSPLKHPEFYVGTGVFALSAGIDVHMTKLCEANHTCVEAYKGHDTYKYITPLIAIVGGMTYGCEIMLHDHKWWRRTVCPGIGIGLSIQHWKDANTIYKESPYAQR